MTGAAATRYPGRSEQPGQQQKMPPWPLPSPHATAAAAPPTPTAAVHPAGLGRRCWPGSHPDDPILELIAEIEIVRLRERFNRRSGGHWGVLYDPFARRWIGIKGKQHTIIARTPAELDDWIASGFWATPAPA